MREGPQNVPRARRPSPKVSASLDQGDPILGAAPPPPRSAWTASAPVAGRAGYSWPGWVGTRRWAAGGVNRPRGLGRTRLPGHLRLKRRADGGAAPRLVGSAREVESGPERGRDGLASAGECPWPG